MNKLKSIIRESVKRILLEEVYGNLAIVYHGSRSSPAEMATYFNEGFKAGKGAGGMYGFGLYTVYTDEKDLHKTMTGTGGYGKYVYKIRADLNGFIIFDAEPCKKVYGEALTIRQQLERLGLNNIIERIDNDSNKISSQNLNIDYDINNPPVKYTSNYANIITKYINNDTNGIIFTGKTDGQVAILFSPKNSGYLVSWCEGPFISDKKMIWNKEFKDQNNTTVDTSIARKRVATKRTVPGEYEKDNLRMSKSIPKVNEREIALSLIDRLVPRIESDFSLSNLKYAENAIKGVSKQVDDYYQGSFEKATRLEFVKKLLEENWKNLFKLFSIENLPEDYISLFRDADGLLPPKFYSSLLNLEEAEITMIVSSIKNLSKTVFGENDNSLGIYNLVLKIGERLVDRKRIDLTIEDLLKVKAFEDAAIYSEKGRVGFPDSKRPFSLGVNYYLQEKDNVHYRKQKDMTLDREAAINFFKHSKLDAAKELIQKIPATKRIVNLIYKGNLLSAQKYGTYFYERSFTKKDLLDICLFLIRNGLLEIRTAKEILMSDPKERI